MDYKAIGLALVAIVIAIGAYFHGSVQTIVKSFGTAVSCGGSTTCLLGDFNLSGAFSFGTNNPSTAEQQQLSIATCNSGSYVASSTQFVVSNPFAATSTATIASFVLTGQATSTQFSVGTTTKSVGLALADVSASLTNGAVVATTSVSTWVIPGQTTTGLGTGQVSAGGSVSKIIVGPSENIAMFATSSAPGLGLNYTPGIGCTAKIVWNN